MRRALTCAFLGLWVVALAPAVAAPPAPQSVAPSQAVSPLNESVPGSELTRVSVNARAEERELADLAAQQEMARYARWQVWITLLTLGVAVASISGTLIALYQTRQSLNLTRSNSQAELRPYLGIAAWTGAQIMSDPSPHLEWTIKNYGSTPALDIAVWMSLRLVDGKPDSHPISCPADAVFVPGQPLPPNASTELTFMLEAAVKDEDRKAIADGEKSFAIALVIRFLDCFGATHEFRFSEIRSGADLKSRHTNGPSPQT